ncbi:hypothetical protein APR04_001665 [Promicromonospora umidemergens]|uniref:Chromosome partition protein Smc n=1 Tax=Promicromonospora umidemergens TaxID=629679 RepID=A0ABP8Y2F0_9MICO|nr:hypothetical protein [Promicromonospora umidemergens]MCP2282767.1 hypothetical protein [Promicromonospora umidemergens]
MSWEPLATSNPVPGEPDRSTSAGTYYGEIADAMADAYRSLGVMEDMEGFESDAVDKLREKAEDVRGEVNKAETRYRAAAEALTQYGVDHHTAQDDALALLQRARVAQEQVEQDQQAAATAKSNLEDATTASRTSGEDLDPGMRNASSTANGNLSTSRGVLDGIIGELPSIVSAWRTKAGTAATKISEAIEADDLNDGMWEKWGKGLAEFVSKWAGKIAMWAGIAALFLGWVPILGQILTAIAIVATIAALVADIALVAHGEGDWVNVLLGVIGVASFGVGRFVGAFGKAAAAKGVAQGASRQARMSRNVSKFGSPQTRATVRNALSNATKAFKSVPYTKLNPVSWVKSGLASFKGLSGRAGVMNFMGHGEAARAYQTLRNVDDIAQFSKNATGYVGTMGRLGSLNPAKVGSFGSALVPYATDVAANSTLLYRDVRTW